MSTEEVILEAVRALPIEKQKEILDHAAKLHEQSAIKIPFHIVKGLWADLGISLSAETIEDNPRQIWRNFPNED